VDIVCSICLISFQEKGHGDYSTCGHMHQKCIDEKLRRGATGWCSECRVSKIKPTPEQLAWEKALDFWIRKAYDDCFREASIAVVTDLQSPHVNSILGDLYNQGLGVEQDKEKAKAHFDVAMAGGDAHSAMEVGHYYKAKRCFKEASDAYETSLRYGAEDAEERVIFLQKCEAAFEALKTSRRHMRLVDAKLRADREFVLLAVAIEGHALEFASEELQADAEIVFEAVQQAGYSLQFAAPTLRDDSEFISRLVVAVGGWVLEFASESVCRDRQVVLAAVRKDGGALRYADSRLQADAEVVSCAVRQDGLALEFASENLRSHADMVAEAVVQNASALRFASDCIRGDGNWLLSVMRQSSCFLFYHAATELRSDRTFVRKVLKLDGLALRFATEELANDPELLLEALGSRGQKWSSSANDEAPFSVEAGQRCGWVLSKAPKELLDDRAFMLKAAKQSSQALNFASERLRSDHSSVLEVVKTKGSSLQFVPQICLGDRGLVCQAVKKESSAMFFANEELREDTTFLNEALGSHNHK